MAGKASGPRVKRRPRFARNIKFLRSIHLCSNSSNQLQKYVSVVVRPDYHVSMTPLKGLTKISLQELSIDCTYYGGYLILRTIEPTIDKDTITTIVEDHKGKGAILKLFNYTVIRNHKCDIMPLGTVFVLKEPICSESIEGDCIIRCESLSDIIVVYEGHELSRLTDRIKWKTLIIDPILGITIPTTAYEWKDTGNDFYEREQYELSTRCYYLAQKCIGGAKKAALRKLLHLKFAKVYAAKGFYEKSLKFVAKVLLDDIVNSKALASAGKSCYQLGKYDEACRYYKTDGTRNADVKMIKSCNARIDENENGIFNMREIFKAHRERRSPDIANYNGPIKVAQIEGKGRGVVVTEDITPGTLLVVSKALAFSCKEVENKNEIPNQTYHDCLNQPTDQENQTEEFEYWQDLLVQLAQKINYNPNTFGPVIYSLYDGKSPDDVDLKTVFCDPETEYEPIVDMAKLKYIIDRSTIFIDISETKNGYGVFEWPCHFNHCCLPNTSAQIFNDVLVIRAIQSIKEGEEACMPCISSDVLLHLRRKLCSIRSVQCTCRFCKMDIEISEITQTERLQFLDKYKEIFSQVAEGRTSIDRQITMDIRSLIRKFEQHNMDPFIRKMVIASVYTLFAKAVTIETEDKNLINDSKNETEIRYHRMVLTYSGFNPTDMLKSIEDCSELIPKNAFLNVNVLLAVVGLISNYNSLGDTNCETKWSNILSALELCYFGDGIRVLEFLKT